jgi:hypothetical protein
MFSGEYKIGVFGKKNSVSLFLYGDHIEGNGEEVLSGKFKDYSFDIKYDNIKKIDEKTIEGNRCLIIEFLFTNLLGKEQIVTLAFPGMKNMEEAQRALSEEKEGYKKRLEEQRLAEVQSKQQKLLEQQRHEEECRAFFTDCYNFHIVNEKNPYYEIYCAALQFVGIYIDHEKNLNFLKLDGNHQEEDNACIPYEKIHYYEKAGAVHYTTDINGHYSNFGGSFTGATVSAKASIVGGLLFGPMGMAAGALLTHKPAKFEQSTNSFDLSSEAHKIDDRSVILNYYSDTKQQFVDIELPADSYNFLQTYLPERKYGIVLEIEKKNAINMYGNNLRNQIENQSVQEIGAASDNTEQFEKKIRKLKIMYDNGLLSDEEYASEKNKILSSL